MNRKKIFATVTAAALILSVFFGTLYFFSINASNETLRADEFETQLDGISKNVDKVNITFSAVLKNIKAINATAAGPGEPLRYFVPVQLDKLQFIQELPILDLRWPMDMARTPDNVFVMDTGEIYSIDYIYYC